MRGCLIDYLEFILCLGSYSVKLRLPYSLHFRIGISKFLSGYSQCVNNAFYYVRSVFCYRSPTVSVPSEVCLTYPKMAVGIVDTRV